MATAILFWEVHVPNVSRTAGDLYKVRQLGETLAIDYHCPPIMILTLLLLVLTVSQGGLFGMLLLSFLTSKITAIATSILNLRSFEILETRQPPEVNPKSLRSDIHGLHNFVSVQQVLRWPRPRSKLSEMSFKSQVRCAPDPLELHRCLMCLYPCYCWPGAGVCQLWCRRF